MFNLAAKIQAGYLFPFHVELIVTALCDIESIFLSRIFQKFPFSLLKLFYYLYFEKRRKNKREMNDQPEIEFSDFISQNF